MLAALLWDVDGTLAETERDGHRVAFNQAFAAAGLPWHWDARRYGTLLRVAGGRERLLRDMATRADAPEDADEREALARELHRLKNGFYARIVEGGGLPLRPGVRALLDDCARAGLRMGIVTTTSRANVQALLAAQLGAGWAQWFATVVCAEDAPRKKPHPEAYLCALARLELHPWEALAIEDSPLGVRAARAAGVPVVVTRSHYFAADAVDGALAAGPGLDGSGGWQPHAAWAASSGQAGPAAPAQRIGLAQLRAWHAQAHMQARAPSGYRVRQK